MADHRRRWRDLSARQRTGIVVGAVVQIALLGATLQDLRHRSADELHGSRALWTGLAFVNIVGPIGYFAFGRRRRREDVVPTA